MGDAATTHRTTVSYIDRTREYYRAQGYDKPYRWARFDAAPFESLAVPLAQCTVGLITTASPFHERPPQDGVLRATSSGERPVNFKDPRLGDSMMRRIDPADVLERVDRLGHPRDRVEPASLAQGGGAWSLAGDS